MGNQPFKNDQMNRIGIVTNNMLNDGPVKVSSSIDTIPHDVEFTCPIIEKQDIIKSEVDDILNTKSTLDYEYIVFSGGGIKGISYCGAIEVLRKLDILDKIKGFAGTSAGSIMASLLAIGYSCEEIKTIMQEMDMADIIDGNMWKIREGLNLVNSYGLVPGNFVHDFLGKIIRDKTGSEDYTIEQLYLDRNIKLVIVATDISESKTRYFYHESPIESDRKIPIRQAIRMSMGIPFLFEPIMHLDNYHVDGGMLDNYPIHVFDGDYPGDLSAKNNMVKANSKVLGLRIVTEEQNDLVKIDSMMNYGMSLILAFMAENDRRESTIVNTSRTIKITTPYFPMNYFTISSEEKDNLIHCGRKSTVEYFISHLT